MKKACILFQMLIFTSFIFGQTEVKNKIIYEHKGTASQKSNGFLYVNDYLLPDVFNQVYFQGKMYEFKTSQNPLEDEGYISTYANLMIVVSVDEIQSIELSKGWYLGNKLKKGTPEDWLFVKWKTNSAYVAPDKFGSLIEAQNPPYLRRTKSKQSDKPLFYKLFMNWYNDKPEKEDKQFIIDLANLEIEKPDCSAPTFEYALKCWSFFEDWERVLKQLRTKNFIEAYLLCKADPVGEIRTIISKVPKTYTNRINDSLRTCSIIVSTQKEGKRCGFEHNYLALAEEIKALMRQ